MDIAAKIPVKELNNGIQIPQIGFGVFKIEDGSEVEEAIKVAFKAGYRSIDTAAIYGNEEGVGRAIAYSGIPREELFITTKVWNNDQGYNETLQAFDNSLERLGLDYIDQYLIHWPKPTNNKISDTWRAMEQLYEDGKTRAIGVSNFKPDHLDNLLKDAKITPAINQIELHPRLTQLETRNYCQGKGIAIESWSPLMQGGELLNDATISGIANAHGKEPAQVILRWHIQSGLVVIPKSVTPERIRDNINIFNFELSGDEMRRIDNLNQNKRIGPDPDSF
ncbi:MAG: aldo/keto reductase [Candidatus Saccharimonadales bacterium]